MSIGVKHYGVNDPKPRPGVPNNRKSKPFGMKGHPFDALKGMLLPLKTPPPRWEPGNEPIPGTRSSADEKVKATMSDQPGFLDAKVAGSVVVRSNRVQLDNDVTAPGTDRFYGTDSAGTKGFFGWVATLATFVKNSITVNADDGKLELAGDEEKPGNNKVYGTDTDGVKGWFPGVAKSGVNTGDILQWNDDDDKKRWEVVDVAGMSDDDILQWNDTDKVWEPVALPASVPDGAADGDIISWDQTTDEAWEVHSMSGVAEGDMMRWNNSTKKWTKLTPSAITVVTAMQYDTTNHVIQIKTRANVKVVGTAAESGWTTITGGSPVSES